MIDVVQRQHRPCRFGKETHCRVRRHSSLTNAENRSFTAILYQSNVFHLHYVIHVSLIDLICIDFPSLVDRNKYLVLIRSLSDRMAVVTVPNKRTSSAALTRTHLLNVDSSSVSLQVSAYRVTSALRQPSLDQHEQHKSD